MAVIAHHVLHGNQTVVLDEAAECNGETFEAGTHFCEVDGRDWTDFDRRHPGEGQARDMAWGSTAHPLVAELGVGSVRSSTLGMGLGLAALLGGLGFTFRLTGAGLNRPTLGMGEAETLEAATCSARASHQSQTASDITTGTTGSRLPISCRRLGPARFGSAVTRVRPTNPGVSTTDRRSRA